MNKIILFLFIFFLIFSNHSYSLDTKAKQAIIYDLETNTVIFEKNADDLMSPSSMSKLMTVYYTFKKLKEGEISLDDTFKVSKKAWKKGGSRMFVNPNSYVTIEDLLKGIIIQSGNDACITIAEGFSGTEENFANELNQLASEIGLENSNFTNSTGWPDPDHLMTARDIMKLSIRTIQDFPELYQLYSEKEFTYNKIRQVNRNPLLFNNKQTDGLKTGHTSLGGYGLSASAIKNNRRIMLVINGLESNSDRKKESKRLMDAAFFQFKNFKILDENDDIEKINVWGGVKGKLSVYTKNNLSITIPSLLQKKIKVLIQYSSPIFAPVRKDDVVAKLVIKNGNDILKEFDLFAKEEIIKTNFINLIILKFKYLVFGESIYKN
ncbi:D-alanyl-D-alanine carboxypeptidase [Rickettsiales bacterium]|nr:D-alanyl-D-alanine carboxypeptidase [Rickettsiales bacterium]